MSFDENTYKLHIFFMKEQESKDKTYSFIKVATNVMFNQIFAKANICFLEKAVADMIK